MSMNKIVLFQSMGDQDYTVDDTGAKIHNHPDSNGDYGTTQYVNPFKDT
jgi:hypothetical protein